MTFLFSIESNPESRVRADPTSGRSISAVNATSPVKVSGRMTLSLRLTGLTQMGPRTKP